MLYFLVLVKRESNNDDETIKIKEVAITELGDLFAKMGKADGELLKRHVLQFR